MNLRTKTLLPLLLVFIISIAIIVGVIVFRQSKVIREDIEDLTKQIAFTESEKISVLLDKAYYIADSLSKTLEGYSDIESSNSRQFALQSLKGALASNKDFVGVWACFEPNAFDGNDDSFKNKDPFTSEGLFASYWYHSNDELSVTSLEDYQTSEWYTKAFNSGKPVLLEPFPFEVAGEKILMTTMAVPIKNGNNVIGVVGIDIPLDSFQKKIEGIHPMETGYVFVVSSNALAVAHPNLDVVNTEAGQYFKNPQAFRDAVKRGATYSEVKEAVGGEKSNSIFYMVPLTISGIEENWSFGISAPLLKVREQQNALMLIGVITGLIFTFIAGLVIFLIVRSIIKPINLLSEGADCLALGDIQVTGIDKNEIKKINERKDELGQIGRSFSKLIDYQKEKAEIAQEIAKKNLRIDVMVSSEQDILGKSFQEMISSLNELLGQVNSAVEQVNSGADQVSQASQSLSQGATEQASSLEEITSSTNQINSQSKQNAENATEAHSIASKATEDAKTGDKQMKQLSEIMQRINASSDEINKVVKVIDDIAFQINLLALNANVEAARAGKYGKGFAVVADEVRNLAVKSADSVKETTQMVEETVKNITEGTTAAKATAEQLQSIVDGSGKVANFLEEIAQASREQAQAIEQITEGLDQIDEATQSNTASAEESASASEELAGQAQQLRSMVAQFQIDERYTSGRHVVHKNTQAKEYSYNNRGSSGNGGKTTTAIKPVDPDEVISLEDEDFDRF